MIIMYSFWLIYLIKMSSYASHRHIFWLVITNSCALDVSEATKLHDEFYLKGEFHLKGLTQSYPVGSSSHLRITCEAHICLPTRGGITSRYPAQIPRLVRLESGILQYRPVTPCNGKFLRIQAFMTLPGIALELSSLVSSDQVRVVLIKTMRGKKQDQNTQTKINRPWKYRIFQGIPVQTSKCFRSSLCQAYHRKHNPLLS